MRTQLGNVVWHEQDPVEVSEPEAWHRGCGKPLGSGGLGCCKKRTTTMSKL
jgi:hypothetical protein